MKLSNWLLPRSLLAQWLPSTAIYQKIRSTYIVTCSKERFCGLIWVHWHVCWRLSNGGGIWTHLCSIVYCDSQHRVWYWYHPPYSMITVMFTWEILWCCTIGYIAAGWGRTLVVSYSGPSWEGTWVLYHNIYTKYSRECTLEVQHELSDACWGSTMMLSCNLHLCWMVTNTGAEVWIAEVQKCHSVRLPMSLWRLHLCCKIWMTVTLHSEFELCCIIRYTGVAVLRTEVLLEVHWCCVVIHHDDVMSDYYYYSTKYDLNVYNYNNTHLNVILAL